ncbi:MAG: hypothetical protein AB3N23_10865 [Paracoccaceae bacterium]
MNRRELMTGAVALPVAASPTDATRRKQLDMCAAVIELEASATPHLGAGDRYTVVRRDKLDALTRMALANGGLNQ